MRTPIDPLAMQWSENAQAEYEYEQQQREFDIVVAITGGRYVPNTKRQILIPTPAQILQFWRLWFRLGACKLANGCAIGTDQYVRRLVPSYRQFGFDFEVLDYPVDTNIDGPWPATGHRRNERMLRESDARHLIAFPGGRGTRGCILQAVEFHIPVYLWFEGEQDFKLMCRRCVGYGDYEAGTLQEIRVEQCRACGGLGYTS